MSDLAAIKEFHWQSAQNVRIYAAEWPVDKARAVVGLIHGLGEHCRRYDHWGRLFQNEGIAMVAYDRQGYGRSEGRKGHSNNWDYYLDTIGRLAIECETRYPDRPVYLYGHSLGGGLLLQYLLKRHPNINGAIISAPYIRLAFPAPAAKVMMGKMMRKVWPSLTLPTGLNLNHLSRSPEIGPAYAADPYTHSYLSAKTGIDMLETADWLDNYNNKIDLPLLIMHGTDDQITSPQGSRDFFDRISGDDIHYKSWDGLYHELHNEPERQAVFNDVLSWLNTRIPNAESQRELKSI